MATLIFTSSGAPTTTPEGRGRINIDVVNDRVYISTDNTSSSDWQLIPQNISEITADADFDYGGITNPFNLQGIDFQDFASATISGGVLAPQQSFTTILNEGAAATDDIDTITVPTNINVLFFIMGDAAQVPTFKHNTGNIHVSGGADLQAIVDTVYMFVYDGTNWVTFDPTGTSTSFPIDDGTTLLKGSIDPSKRARFECDTNIPPSTTIVVELPSSDCDMDELLKNVGSGTDNAVPKFQGSGTEVQNTGVIIDDSDNMSGVNLLTLGGHLNLPEIAAPATPASGTGAIYFKSDGNAYAKNDAGTESVLSTSGSTLPVTDTTAIAEGSVDSTKQVRFECDTNIPTSTTVVLTMPSADLDLDNVLTSRTGVYRTISFPAGAMTPRTTAGAASGTEELTTNDIDLDFFDFDAATDEGVQVAFMMPDEWDLSTVKFKFIWKDATTTGTGNVVWGVRGVAVSNDDALDATFGTAVTVTDAFITAGDNHVSDATAAVTIGGTPALGDLTILEFYRDADNGSDTYTQDARLLGVVMQYQESTTEPSQW